MTPDRPTTRWMRWWSRWSLRDFRAHWVAVIEIALDLAEHGVRAALSVRSPLNIVYRDVLGRPTQLSSILLSKLPPALGDAAATLLRDLSVGDLGRYGLHTAAVSPLRQLRETIARQAHGS